MNQIIRQIIKNILLFLLVLFLCLALFSTNWALESFHFLHFDEVLFQLTTPIKSTSTSVLSSFFKDSFLISILAGGIAFSFLYILFHYLTCNYLEVDIQLFKKKFHFKWKSKTAKRVARFFVFLFSVGLVYYCLDKMLIIDFVKAQMDDSPFIEEHYVDPKGVSISFPEEKRNLIYIYAESMESTFFSSDLGGGGGKNLLSPLQDITSENISFSDTELFGGAKMVTGTTWTSASMVAQTSGLPLKNSLDNVSGISSMLSGAYSLGNILEDNGYSQEIMFGSDASFGNRGAYFTSHGHYKIFDYNEAIQKKKISKDYYVWWGFEDSKLFEFAKEEITSLASSEEPFNFTMLTVDTHSKDGYLEDSCPRVYSDQYDNTVHCSAMQIADFISWIQEQDFYENTTVIVVGDHVSMQEGYYPDDVKRRSYNVFINSAVTEGNFHNRSFTLMDFFPTTLASLGATIEGEKLGLGTNLFSDQPTLMEEVGEDLYQTEISKYSSYYMKQFYYS